ncbi:ABC transporter substrate binding protein [Candidatus Symbiobacter mobilis]|uniref:histidine kinase n=1 Tax=Candidatus Symbiobacter mobilis CR TaxID=946483 RepID=U5NAJ2_9BURK|nr:ABC transporter substrate binding protein [Candidatus Symbiobacter mobilis]AGX88397.1 signal transduction histidine kinase [Candidatus Symbiobacter mobilis CR]
MKTLFSLAALLFALIVGIPRQAEGAAPVAATAEPAHVLVLLSYHHGHSWEDDILRGFEAWDGVPAERPVLHIEWMDTKRYASAKDRQRFQRFLEEKYAERRFDLIATMDDNALIEAVKTLRWRDVPIVFGGVNGDPAAIVGERGRATGIAERFNLERTLNLALSLHSHTKRLIFITAPDESGVGNRQVIDANLASLPPEARGRLAIEHWTPSSLDTIDSRLFALPEHAAVFALGTIPKVEGGRPLGNEQLVAHVRGKVRGPVYSDTDRSVGQGASGGYVNSGLENGRLMAKMARRILAGEAPESIPIVFDTPQALILDFNELQRFGVAEENLPVGATVLNRPPSIFDPDNRAILIGFIAAILILTLVLILVLGGLVLRARIKVLSVQNERARDLQIANQALVEAKAAAEAANRAKSEFLSSMSHELRTPLNAIIGFAQLLEMGVPVPLEPSQKEAVGNILGGGRHLLGLVNEVLDLARIEAGKLDLVTESFPLMPLMEKVIAFTRLAASPRRITIRSGCGVCTSCWQLHADRSRTNQILLNLISNATKYNRDGGMVAIDCSQGTAGVRITVTDTGYGIAPERQAQLFEPFHRLGAEKSSIEGTGIGLVISKKLADAMGGRIGFESEVGVGSRFWLELPAVTLATIPCDSTVLPAPTIAPPEALPGRRVLYIEDNQANLSLMKSAFRQLPGVALEIAETGEAGLAQIRMNPPDLVLLDGNLPGMNGLEVLRILKDNPQTAAMPVVIVSAAASPQNIQAGMDAGATAYFTKPFDLPALLAKVRQTLEGKVAPHKR